MSAGTTTVDDNGNVHGSGLSLAIYSAQFASASANKTLPDPNNPPASMTQFGPIDDATRASLATARLKTMKQMAIDATALATGIVSYLQANATIDLTSVHAQISTITSTGRVPTPITTGTPIEPPSLAVNLPLVGTATLS